MRLEMWDADLEMPLMAHLRDLVVAFDADERDPESIRRQHSPRRHRGLAHMMLMTPGEQYRVRLLATLADRPAWGRAPEFAVSDLLTFDDAGKDLIVDYLRAVRVAVCG